MPDDFSQILLIGAALLLVLGAASMRFYWRVADPWLRRVLGRALGVTVVLGEQNIWPINEESVDSLNPRNLIVRPLQMLSLMVAAMLPVLATVAILIALTGRR